MNARCLKTSKTSLMFTLGQNSTLYPEIAKNLVLIKGEFCEKCYVNFVINEISEM